MRVSSGTAIAGLVIATTTVWASPLSKRQADRIDESATVLNEIHNVPEKDIPQDLWNKAECVIVIPSLKKAAFVFGGEYGRGIMSCRNGREWSAPLFMDLEKGSWGLQIGAQSIDLVLVVMNRGGMEKMFKNKVSLGAEASVAAGPVGRDAAAATDAQLKAEILSYSRAQGLFAGIDVSGGVLKPDPDDNEDLYGKKITPRDVITDENTKTPEGAAPFLAALRAR